MPYEHEHFFFANLKKKLNLVLFSTVILLPFSLITGPFISDLLCVICSIIFLIVIEKNDFKRYFINKFSLVFFILCFYFIINSYFSISPLLSLESSLFYVRFGLLSLSVWYLIENYVNFKNFFYISLSLVISLLLVDGLLQYTFGYNLLGFEYNTVKVTSFFGSEEKLGSYLSRLFPLFFALFFLKKQISKFEILFLVTIFIFTNLMVFLSGERTSFFYQIFSSIILITLGVKFKMIRITTFVFSILVIIIILSYNEKLYQRMITSTFDSFTSNKLFRDIVDSESQNNTEKKANKSFLQKYKIFSAQHEAHYLVAYEMFIEKPFIGHGPKLFRLQCKKEKYYKNFFKENKIKSKKMMDIMKINSCNTHPHNYYLQLLAETGVIGTIPFMFTFFVVLFLMAKQFYYSLSNKKFLNDYQIGLLCCVFISLWPIAPNGNFFGNWLSIIVYTPVGFILYEIRHILQFK